MIRGSESSRITGVLLCEATRIEYNYVFLPTYFHVLLSDTLQRGKKYPQRWEAWPELCCGSRSLRNFWEDRAIEFLPVVQSVQILSMANFVFLEGKSLETSSLEVSRWCNTKSEWKKTRIVPIFLGPSDGGSKSLLSNRVWQTTHWRW